MQARMHRRVSGTLLTQVTGHTQPNRLTFEISRRSRVPTQDDPSADVTGHARTLFSVGIGSSRRCGYSHGACVYTCACAAVEWKGQRLKGKREGREKPVRNWKPSRGETSSDRTMGSRANCSSSSTCRPVCCVSPGLRHQTAHARRLRPDRMRGKVLHAAFSAVLDAFDRLALVARYPDERVSEAFHDRQFETKGEDELLTSTNTVHRGS